LKLGNACGFDGIPNEYLLHLPRRHFVHLTNLLNHCLQIGHFLAPWKEEKIITLHDTLHCSKPEFGRCSVQLLAGTLATMTEIVVVGSSQSPQANAGLVPQLGHDCFLLNPYQFYIHQSSCHSILCSLDIDSIIK
jgi:hypothetical protein